MRRTDGVRIGVVVHEVDATEPLKRRLCKLLPIGDGCHITMDVGRGATDLERDRLAELVLDVRDNDARSLIRKPPRSCRADTARPACDDGDLALKPPHRCTISSDSARAA